MSTTTVEMERRYRTLHVREVDAEERTVEGIAVPYNTPTYVGGIREVVERGALDADEPIQFFYSHDHRTGGMPVGRVIEHRDTDEGLWARARISKTAKGDELLTLLRDGVINKFSVGFDPLNVRHEVRDGVDTYVIARADDGSPGGIWRELSVALNPVYPDAQITQVRSREESAVPDTDTTGGVATVDHTAEINELRDQVTTLERQYAVLADGGSGKPTSPLSQYRSFGEYVKAVASGDESALSAYGDIVTRDFTDTTDSVVRDAWVDRTIRIVEENRRVLAAFDRQPLPAEGMKVEYPLLDTTGTTIAVDTQSSEGDALTYGELVITSASADVATYGGYTSMSRQVIERSSVPYLTTAFRALAIEYAKRTNKAVRDTIETAASNGDLATIEADFSDWDASDWINFVVDAAAAIEQTGLQLDFLYVSADVYKAAAGLLGADERPVFVLPGQSGSNTVGGISPARLSGNLMAVPLLMDSNLASGSLYAASREALTTYEAPGAPFRLQDDNVVNLTSDFSVYGYAAVAIPFPGAIVARIDEES